jgi:hypothetical protein
MVCVAPAEEPIVGEVHVAVTDKFGAKEHPSLCATASLAAQKTNNIVVKTIKLFIISRYYV